MAKETETKAAAKAERLSLGGPVRVAIGADSANVGEVVRKPGDVIAEVRLDPGVTLGQLAAAIMAGKTDAPIDRPVAPPKS